MSRYTLWRGDRTVVAYGFDAPTGGYFWQHYNDVEELDSRDGLTLTQLEHALVKRLGVTLTEERYEKLLGDFYTEDEPTPLQVNVGLMLGKNIIRMLRHVKKDVDARLRPNANI
jgi:hypothetical protein